MFLFLEEEDTEPVDTNTGTTTDNTETETREETEEKIEKVEDEEKPKKEKKFVDDIDTGSSSGTTTSVDNTDSDTDDSMEEPTDTEGKSKEEIQSIKRKLVIFDDYKRLYELCDKFLIQASNFKQNMSNDKIDDEEQNSVIIFIIKEVNSIKDNIKYILVKQMKNLDNSKLDLFFVNFKTKIELLIELFKQINNSINDN